MLWPVFWILICCWDLCQSVKCSSITFCLLLWGTDRMRGGSIVLKSRSIIICDVDADVLLRLELMCFVLSLICESPEGRGADLRRQHLSRQMRRSEQTNKFAASARRLPRRPLKGSEEEPKATGISNICPTLVCPLGPLCPRRPCGQAYQLVWRSGVCFSPLCYRVRQACQRSLLWRVERPLTDRLAWPSCQSQVSQTHSVRRWDYKDTDCCLSGSRLSTWLTLPESKHLISDVFYMSQTFVSLWNPKIKLGTLHIYNNHQRLLLWIRITKLRV